MRNNSRVLFVLFVGFFLFLMGCTNYGEVTRAVVTNSDPCSVKTLDGRMFDCSRYMGEPIVGDTILVRPVHHPFGTTYVETPAKVE